ncbi:MAG: hypothetical protein ACOCYQ_01365 [Alkalispirochaeta sp.]
MKKITTIVVALTVMASVAYAEQLSDTGSLTISGTVDKMVRIAVTPTGNENLDLTADVTDHSVASINEYSNVVSGYTVQVESANSWKLVGQNNDDELEYTAAYDGDGVATSAATAMITDASDRTGGRGTIDGVNKAFAISYDAATANLYNDYYEDTLTFTITAK